MPFILILDCVLSVIGRALTQGRRSASAVGVGTAVGTFVEAVGVAVNLGSLLTLLAWCRHGEAGSGEAAINDVAAVLDLAEAVSEGAHQVVGVGEGGVGLAAVSQQ